eukprot:1771961-Pyramimonas_sp.AAC.1
MRDGRRRCRVPRALFERFAIFFGRRGSLELRALCIPFRVEALASTRRVELTSEENVRENCGPSALRDSGADQREAPVETLLGQGGGRCV